MKDKLYRPGEVATVRDNIREIEKALGEPIPGGLIDISEIRDHLLSPGEILTYCENIKEIRGKSYNRTPKIRKDSSSEKMIGIALVGLGALLFILESLLGINIF